MQPCKILDKSMDLTLTILTTFASRFTMFSRKEVPEHISTKITNQKYI